MHVRRTPPSRGTSTRARRLLVAALAVTALALALGASGLTGLQPVRGVAAAVL